MNMLLLITQVSTNHIEQGFLMQGYTNYTKVYALLPNYRCQKVIQSEFHTVDPQIFGTFAYKT
jgi:hypothetical protein